MFAVGLSHMAFVVLKKILFMHFLESFCHKLMLNFVKSLLCLCWDDHTVFILQLVDVMYHMDSFGDIEKSLQSWINPTWSRCMILLMYSWFNLLVFCWEFLQLCSSVIWACDFIYYFFFCGIFVCFWNQDDGDLISLGEFLLLFLEEVQKNGCWLFKCLIEFNCEAM